MIKQTINIGKIDQFPLGFSVCVVVNNEEIAVVRPRTGGMFALENRCPHRQGPLSDGVIGDGKIVCPLHGHKFDLKTGQGSEASECVRVFRIWEEGSDIYLEYES